MKKILSIDGGGIRGIVPSMVLMEIEARTGKPISQLFDLIGGTSTGGILSLGLTIPTAERQPRFSAKDLLALYEKRGKDIFSSPAWHRFIRVGNLLGPKYWEKGIESILKEYFGEARLSEALTNLIITSYDVERRQSYFFKSHKANSHPERDFLVRDVARSTSAAPTYFPPNRLNVSGGSDYYALVDGGVFANNPAMCAYVEARSIFKDEKDFLVISIGTGENTKRMPYSTVKGWGLLSWAPPLLDVVFDGINDTIDYQLQQLLVTPIGQPKSYYRFQIALNNVREDMDDVSDENIRGLKLLGDELVRKNNDLLNEVCARLSPDTATRTSGVMPRVA